MHINSAISQFIAYNLEYNNEVNSRAFFGFKQLILLTN
jgi:hypothetical protein